MTDIEDFPPIEQFIVIDDDPTTLFLCKVIIQRVFDQMLVVTYNDPQKAIQYFSEAFSENPVETVIILDINMPEVSGWEVLEMLSTLNEKLVAKLTVIMLSSSIDPKDKLQATSHSLVSGYLEKPLTTARLEGVLVLMKSAMSV